MAAAFPIGVVGETAVAGHSKALAGPTAVAHPAVAHTVVVVLVAIVADHIAMVAIEVDPLVVAHTVAEVALVALVDYP